MLLKKMLVLFTLLTLANFGAQAKASCGATEIHLAAHSLCVSHDWLEGPYLNGRGERNFSRLILRFRADDQSHATAANLGQASYWAWMIMPGGHQHGTRPIKVENVSEAEVTLGQIMFTQMPGEWFIRINLNPQSEDNPATDFDASIPVLF